ncbi:MAG: Trm112 family protein [Arachnia sp.]
MSESSIDLSPEFLAIAACPACHAKFAVDYDRGELVCTSNACGLAYPVRDRIPVLLIDQARNTR